MKTIILVVFSALTISVTLSGQPDLYKYQFKNPLADNILSIDISGSSLINRYSDISQKIDLSGYNNQHPDLGLKQFPRVYRHYPDSAGVEEFPGSSRFYAKWPRKNFYSYEKSFIMEPDTTVKYYLIIRDPIHHKTIK